MIINSPDVIFVGAGPVGLFTAIQAKLHNPALNIQMFERNEEYTRSHILKIEPSSYEGAYNNPDNPYNEEFQQILTDLHGPVRTTEIERRFRELAVKMGIGIQTGSKVENVRDLAKQYPSAKTIVGADGARSGVRQQLFGDRKRVDRTYQTIIEVKYEVEGRAPRINPYNLVSGLTQIHHFVAENVGKTRNGRTPVSLFFFADEQTGDLIRAQGNPRTPVNLQNIADVDTTLPRRDKNRLTKLANSILPWLAYRASYGEKRVENSEKIAAVALNVYESEDFVVTEDGVRYLLVGDAAMGVPYFRALNAGFLGATKAARLLGSLNPALENQHQAFQNDMHQLATREIRGAFWKNLGVNLGRLYRKIIHNINLATAYDTMPEAQRQAIREARITPHSFYRRHSGKLLTLAIFLGVSAILIATGGLGLPAILGGLVAGALTALACVVAYQLGTFLIRELRASRKPPVEPGLEDLPLETQPEEQAVVENTETNYLELIRSYGNVAEDDTPEHFPHPAGCYSLRRSSSSDPDGIHEGYVSIPDPDDQTIVALNFNQ
jgi:2-polyprenyl-6-methoxyphenol hydroxylase-like FAD-dependent oxidoreductase